MKNLSLASTALLGALLLAGAAAHAGPAKSFDGFYIGGEVGGVNSSTKVNDSDRYFGQGITGGLFAGYGLTFGSFYFGAEANGSLSSLKTTLGATDLNRKYGFGIAGRAGYVMAPSTMAYGVVGWERGRFEAKLNNASENTWADGLRLGAGVEHKLTQNISLRGEFDFTNWQKKEGIRSHEYSLKAGVSYRF